MPSIPLVVLKAFVDGIPTIQIINRGCMEAIDRFLAAMEVYTQPAETVSLCSGDLGGEATVKSSRRQREPLALSKEFVVSRI